MGRNILTMSKYIKTITSQEDEATLQKVIDVIKEWCDKSLLKLTVSTCKVVSYCTKDTINTSYHITEGNAMYNWDKVESITDLGVNFDKKLSFTERVQQKINKAYSMVVIICIIQLLYYCI